MRKYFGTDGIRRIANTELTPDLVFRVAKAGAYVLAKHSNHKPTILIGRDTRLSGGLIESAMTAGFLSYGADVILLDIIPTPGVAYLTKKLNADAGVVISASHNTFEFNGVKFFSNKGMKISDDLEEEIEEIMDSDKLNDFTAVGENVGRLFSKPELVDEYVDFLIKVFGTTFDNLDKDFCVGLDLANGATYEVAKKVYKKLGINFKVISDNPDGININDGCGSTHLEKLQSFVKENKLNLGIAYDGDGDRCLAVNENGEVIDGDVIMAIISDFFKGRNQLNNNTLVATVMSNLGMKKYAESNGLNYIQTKVGDRYVLEEMLKHGYNFGGEQSGHIIFLDYNPTGDGILTSLMLLKTMVRKNQKVTELSKIIKIYPQVLVGAIVNSDKKYEFDKVDIIKENIQKLEQEFSGNGRVLVRASGTEPKVRVMIEGEDIDYITKKANDLAKLIEENLK